jgi:hypothetical protein
MSQVAVFLSLISNASKSVKSDEAEAEQPRTSRSAILSSQSRADPASKNIAQIAPKLVLPVNTIVVGADWAPRSGLL